MIVVEAKLRFRPLAADFAYAALASEHSVVVHEVGVGDLASLPVPGRVAPLTGTIGGKLSFPILRILRISFALLFVPLLLLL
jgi:hypothetical protein